MWPFSTRDLPKQLVPMLGGRSLLEHAVERASSVADTVWLGTGEALRGAVAVPGVVEERLVIEPSGRDTLPALVLGMATIAASDPDAIAVALGALLDDAPRRAALAVAGHERSLEFTWTASAEAHLASYSRALQG